MAPLERHQETTLSDVGGCSRMHIIDKKTIPLSESIVDSALSSASASPSSSSPSSSQQETKQNDKNTLLTSNNNYTIVLDCFHPGALSSHLNPAFWLVSKSGCEDTHHASINYQL